VHPQINIVKTFAIGHPSPTCWRGAGGEGGEKPGMRCCWKRGVKAQKTREEGEKEINYKCHFNTFFS
jgi:hypothetical protein